MSAIPGDEGLDDRMARSVCLSVCLLVVSVCLHVPGTERYTLDCNRDRHADSREEVVYLYWASTPRQESSTLIDLILTRCAEGDIYQIHP